MGRVTVTKAAALRGAALEKPPVGEIGAPANIGLMSWGSIFLGDEVEITPDWQWPISIATVNTMLNDSQVEGLLAGTTLPIRRYNWMIDANGCDPTMVEKLAADLNLPIKGKPTAQRKRGKGRFSHDRHLFHALRALAFGHYFMEEVAAVGDDGLAHLLKLAPRPPQTIAEIAVEGDGSLRYIKQNVNVQASSGGSYATPEIPASKLIAYVWEQEGANWYGRSMLRACYKNWLIKDRLLRVDALKHERNGMGIPIAEGAPGYGRKELAALASLAQSYKAGDSSGGAIPNGTKLTLQGVQGTLPDTIASIRFHNEEMARRFMMMFMQLGESVHGNRALGEAFIDVFQLNQDTIAEWYRDTTTEHVIEDWWSWNVDPESDTTPFLTFERSDALRDAVTDLAALINSGAIQVDDEIEDAVREAYNLPLRTSPRQTGPPPGQEPTEPTEPNPNESSPSEPPSAKAKRQQRTAGAAGGATSPATLPLPSRPLRRQPADYEVRAQVDFASMDVQWQTALDKLFRDWQNEVTAAQIEHLTSAISKSDNLETLASLEAPALGSAILSAAMREMYDEGVRQAITEAKAQGHEIAEPKAEDYTANFDARAKAVDEVNARTLGNMAGARAMRLSGGTLDREEVADGTREYLTGLRFAMLRDRLGGALTAAMNTGRRAVMAEGPVAQYYSSELLDNNTCVPCTGVDGTQYNSLADSERDYPGGGYVDCLGGDRCRGTVVAVYQEANNPQAGGS